MLKLLKSTALVLAFAAVALTGCRRDAVDGENGASGPYRFGDPLTDSTLALVVSSDFGTDSLDANLFRQEYAMRMQQIMQRDPMILDDTARVHEVRRSLAEAFVFEHVIRGEAKRRNDIQVDSSLADAQIAQIRAQSGEAFEQELAAQGLTVDSVRSYLISQLRAQALVEKLVEEAPQPTAAQIDSFRTAQAQEVRAQHIFFRKFPQYSAVQRDSVQRVANAVLDSARQGVDFGDLARRHGQDGTAALGGDLNYINRAMGYPENFMEAAFALRDSGQVAQELVETEVGWHVIRQVGRREGVPMDTSLARRYLLSERANDIIRSAIERLMRERNVEVRVNQRVVDANLNRIYKED